MQLHYYRLCNRHASILLRKETPEFTEGSITYIAYAPSRAQAISITINRWPLRPSDRAYASEVMLVPVNLDECLSTEEDECVSVQM